MPIVFVHGVATRDDDEVKYQERWKQIETYLRRYIAPEISSHPDQVDIIDAYWGDIGARFAWNGDSRPRTPLLGMGAAAAPSSIEQALALASLKETLGNLPASQSTPRRTGILVPAGPASSTVADQTSKMRLKDFSPDQLSNLAVTIIQNTLQDTQQQTLASLAADVVAHDEDTKDKLAACANREEELSLLKSLIEERYKIEQHAQGSVLIAQGGSDSLQKFKDRLGEVVGRIDSLPGLALSRALAEFRKPINEMVTLFFGDVFTYLKDRVNNTGGPGRIPSRVLTKLKEVKDDPKNKDERLIVLSHSMGGQIVYDLVTYFIPAIPDYKDLRIDFWCATASQVGLFEELKLFGASQDQYGKQHNNQVPFPDRRYLGGWWNVWDHSDFISFSVKNIIADVDDQNYNSGMSLIDAHSAYIQQPAFYRAFAKKLELAKEKNWWLQ
jgi:hypothetical protein